MDDTTVEQKPSRAIALYTPLILGLLTGLFAAPACECPLPELLLLKTVCAIAGIAVWWIVIIAGFRGFQFMKSLFHHPR
jgi:ABC-type uncharacterized transport system permease subunit